MEELKSNGYIHIKNAVDPSMIDNVMNKIKHERDTLPDYGFYEDIHRNLGNRIGRLHYKIDEYYGLLDNVRDIIYNILDKPLIMGSLTFENGSSQAAHIDSWFFYTKPERDMIGIWIALEDVEEEAGPLFYYENSHTLETTDPICFSPNSTADVGNMLSTDLNEKIKDLKKTNVLVKKGDIFIWTYNLVHGGSDIMDISKSRNSIVFHFINEDAELFNFHDYMKNGKNIDSSHKMNTCIKEKLGWKYQDYGSVEYVNNKCTYSRINI